MRTLEQDRTAVNAAVREAREAQAWMQFLIDNPTVLPCESNKRIAFEYFHGEEVTLAGLNDSLQNHPAFRAMLAMQTPAEDREKVLNEYTAELGTSEATRGAVEAAKFLSTEQLRAKAEQLRLKKEYEKKSVPELRAIIKSGTPVVSDENDLPAEMTRARLLSLNKPGEFRRICERYGTKNVTRRLNER
jgi:hypothetical protein